MAWPPRALVPASVAAAAAAATDWPVLAKIGVFFAEAGAFVFGSGLAIVPFLYGGVVNEYQWLNERQFVDAVAVAMITPGPVVITVGFIGYLVAGFPGAVVASLATFLPCYFFTIIPAPYFKKHGKQPGIVAFVDGVTAAAIGAIAGAVVVLGKRSIVDLPTLAARGRHGGPALEIQEADRAADRGRRRLDRTRDLSARARGGIRKNGGRSAAVFTGAIARQAVGFAI